MARPMLYDAARIRAAAGVADMTECETCGELIPEDGDIECQECQQAGMLAYRREHDSGAER